MIFISLQTRHCVCVYAHSWPDESIVGRDLLIIAKHMAIR